jgi:hypothetical protein
MVKRNGGPVGAAVCVRKYTNVLFISAIWSLDELHVRSIPSAGGAAIYTYVSEYTYIYIYIYECFYV